MNKKTREKLLELEIFEPGSTIGYGINTMLLNSTEVAETPLDEIKNELEAMQADGLITHDEGFYRSTVSGHVANQKYLAHIGALQPPLINQKTYSPEDLILAIVASHNLDPTSGHSITAKYSLKVYLHDFSTEEVDAATEQLINDGLIANNDFYPENSIHITGSGFREYHTNIRQKLGLGREEGILSWVYSELKDERFSKLTFDAKLCENIASRWSEMNVCANSGAYLAAIILLGSILEGLLLAKLQEKIKVAMTATRAPKEGKTGTTKKLNEWSLQDYITVSVDLEHIPRSVEKHLHELRDSRNLVHPNKQIISNIIADESLYRISREVIETVIDALIKK